MLPEKQKKTYTAFYDSTVENDILDEKTTVIAYSDESGH